MITLVSSSWGLGRTLMHRTVALFLFISIAGKKQQFVSTVTDLSYFKKLRISNNWFFSINLSDLLSRSLACAYFILFLFYSSLHISSTPVFISNFMYYIVQMKYQYIYNQNEILFWFIGYDKILALQFQVLVLVSSFSSGISIGILQYFLGEFCNNSKFICLSHEEKLYLSENKTS